MLTTAPLWRLVVAHAIWGPTVVDKQNSQNARRSWVYDWLSQRPAAWSEEVGVDLASCWVPVRPVEELKTPHFLSSGGHHRYSVNLDLQVSLPSQWCVSGSSVQGEGPWKRVEILRGEPFMVPWTTQVLGLCEVLAEGGGEPWPWQSLTPVLTAGHTHTHWG